MATILLTEAVTQLVPNLGQVVAIGCAGIALVVSALLTVKAFVQ